MSACTPNSTEQQLSVCDTQVTTTYGNVARSPSPDTGPKQSPAKSRRSRRDRTRTTAEATQETSKLALFSVTSRRVAYKKHVADENNVDLEPDMDETLKGEKAFLKKVEKFRTMKVQRVCVCPMTIQWRVSQSLHGTKMCCHKMDRIAFWPPPSDYFFFDPADDTGFHVDDEEDAIEMKKIKARLKKVTVLKKKHLNRTFSVGMKHSCMEHVVGVKGFVVRTKSNHYIACVHIDAPSQKPRFTMIYSHPNGSDLSDHLVGVPALQDLARFYKCDVICYDYSGYGISSGRPSEKNMCRDLEAVYNHVSMTTNISKMVFLGYSIGTAATVSFLTRRQLKPAGVVLQAPPMSIYRCVSSVWNTKTPLNSPTKKFDRFCTIDKIASIDVPVLIVHGECDRTVPIDHGRYIYEKVQKKVEPEWIPNIGHDNLENCHEIWRRLRSFFKNELKLI